MKKGGKLLSKNLEETAKIARDFLSSLSPRNTATLVCLSGDLGSGKTAFVKKVGEYFGIKENITSPTFVIEKIYKLKNQRFTHLIHVDAYRLESGEELGHLGFEEILKDPGNIVFLEWPERAGSVLREERHEIKFKFVNESEREIMLGARL